VNQQLRPGITVFVEWPASGKAGVALKSVATNADARFLVCEVPRGPVTVRASIDVAGDAKRIVLNAKDVVQLVSIDLPPPLAMTPVTPTATVELQLFDSDNRPMSAKVVMRNGTGPEFSVETDKFGRALLPDQPEGPLSLVVKRQQFRQELIPGYNLVRLVVRDR
jgi:hypothetical protein